MSVGSTELIRERSRRLGRRRERDLSVGSTELIRERRLDGARRGAEPPAWPAAEREAERSRRLGRRRERDLSKVLGCAGAVLSLLVFAASPLAAPSPPTSPPPASPPGTPAMTEVVVLLSSPPVARSSGSRAAAAQRIAAEQRAFVQVLERRVPGASVRWRYRLVANGVAVVVPRAALPRLRSLPGVRDVVSGGTYRAHAVRSADVARLALAAPGLAATGEGVKIAIVDDGIDQRHPYFDSSGYTMPPGYPKGQVAYTSAKVIVARAFPPPGSTSKNAAAPFDPLESSHGTHVAGIAAGNASTQAIGGRRVSGIAPRAYLGNYKALTVPTDAGVGLDGNAPEIVAAIEAAVADGMNVINLSIGEPEVEPSRDLVALALDAAARMGVVPVVAAGNDFGDFGPGSLSSPGSSAQAITVAALGGSDVLALADFSSSGPTPLSLRLKPDVSAPGVGILSSIPGGWESMSGTSMASPYIAGAAALLLQRHPAWTVAQVKAALVGTATPTLASGGSTATAPPTRIGGGLVDLVRADQPSVLASPSSVSFGLVRPGPVAPATVALEDAGQGTGQWSVSLQLVQSPAGTTLSVPPVVQVPGPLVLQPQVAPAAAQGELSGWVVLTRGADVRRIPVWLRVERPALAGERATPLLRPGSYSGDTRGLPARVSTYRYPEVPPGNTVTARLGGPEQLFRISLRAPATNFGVVITKRARGVGVEPRVVANANENRLTGYAALPLNLNPYLAQFGDPVLAVGAVRPLPGSYDVVFDSPAGRGGAFSFRYWVNDVTPPRAMLLTRAVRGSGPLRVRVSDAGAGVDPATLVVAIDGTSRSARLVAGVVEVSTSGLSRGTHALRLQISDYQESRNTESVPPILPNTRVLKARVLIRP